MMTKKTKRPDPEGARHDKNSMIEVGGLDAEVLHHEADETHDNTSANLRPRLAIVFSEIKRSEDYRDTADDDDRLTHEDGRFIP